MLLLTKRCMHSIWHQSKTNSQGNVSWFPLFFTKFPQNLLYFLIHIFWYQFKNSQGNICDPPWFGSRNGVCNISPHTALLPAGWYLMMFDFLFCEIGIKTGTCTTLVTSFGLTDAIVVDFNCEKTLWNIV